MKFYTSLNTLGHNISHINLRIILESICCPLLSICDVLVTQAFQFFLYFSMLSVHVLMFMFFFLCFAFPHPLQYMFLCCEQHLSCFLLSVYLMVSYAAPALGSFLTGFLPCFLSTELCFGMGQEVVFKLTAFWSFLICTLGHAFLLKVIRISL